MTFFTRCVLVSVCTFAGAPHEVRAQSANERDLPETFRTVARVRLNADSAVSLAQKLGAATQWMSGSGHDRYRNWCYRIGVAPSGTTLRVQSDAGEMGSDNGEINVFDLRIGASNSVDGHTCHASTSLASLSGLGPLRLAASRASVIGVLGQGTRATRDSLVYEFSTTEPMNPAGPYYARWNTPEQRKSCFGGKAPFVNVFGQITILFRADSAQVIRVERYDNATC